MTEIPVIIFLIIFTISMIWFYKYLGRSFMWKKPESAFPLKWRSILSQRIPFYIDLNNGGKKRFEYKVHEFLTNVRITGIGTDVDDTDRILVASSAIIPVFSFPEWKYLNLKEVLLYSAGFDSDFKTDSMNRNILGMVGTGYMEGKMILSRPSLHHGFRNESDRKNTAVHEFVHLIDKADGSVDGIPALLMEKQYTIPWLDMIRKNIDDIYKGSSDINPYGATNSAEFFSVISEYFFESPELLKDKHPELYGQLMKIFNTDMVKQHKLHRRAKPVGRNDPCPCGSGKKFKECCGKEHF